MKKYTNDELNLIKTEAMANMAIEGMIPSKAALNVPLSKIQEAMDSGQRKYDEYKAQKNTTQNAQNDS
jgi:hypothetical protein